MKTINHFLLITCLSTGIPILAAEPAPSAPTNEAPSAPATTIQTSTGQPPPAPTATPEAATNASATPAGGRFWTSPPTPSRAPTQSLGLTLWPQPYPPCRRGYRKRHQRLTPELSQRAPEPGPGLLERRGGVCHQQSDRCPGHRRCAGQGFDQGRSGRRCSIPR